MSATIRPSPIDFGHYAPTSLPTGPILVATNVADDSDAAFPVADAIAMRANASVDVLSVIVPFVMPMYGLEGIAVSPETAMAVRESRINAVHEQMDRLVPRRGWPVQVVTGEPARDIAQRAQQTNARVVVVGRGRHSVVERMLDGETVLRLLQFGDAPVFAVDPTLRALPHHVVIATDFSEFSLYAARVAMSFVAPNATVVLVNVAPPFVEADPILRDVETSYRSHAEVAFAQLRTTLYRDGVTIECVILTGNASDALMRYATTVQADLIVTATHGYGFFRRMVLGSVAAALVRHATCSVLCIPGSAHTMAAARARTKTNARTRTFDVNALDAELAAFTSSNAGRRCHVEIDTEELGAQVLGHGLPLVGATYDAHGHAVSLMFGASTLLGQHLTHTVSDVSAIDISANGEGHDQVLRIAHPGGQTLVSLE